MEKKSKIVTITLLTEHNNDAKHDNGIIVCRLLNNSGNTSDVSVQSML